MDGAVPIDAADKIARRHHHCRCFLFGHYWCEFRASGPLLAPFLLLAGFRSQSRVRHCAVVSVHDPFVVVVIAKINRGVVVRCCSCHGSSHNYIHHVGHSIMVVGHDAVSCVFPSEGVLTGTYFLLVVFDTHTNKSALWRDHQLGENDETPGVIRNNETRDERSHVSLGSVRQPVTPPNAIL